MSLKKSLVVTCKGLRLFVNTLTADDKFSPLSRGNLIQPIQPISKTKKFFWCFLYIFQIYIKFWTFPKKYDHHSPCISEITGLRNTRLDKRLKRPVSEHPLTDNVVNGPKNCFNLHNSTFTIFIDQCEGNWVGKSHSWWHSRRFVNTLTADDKYSLLNRRNLMQHIQMHLSQKHKSFSQLLCALLRSIFHFEHFQKKDDPHSLCIREITDSERRG